MLQKALNYDLDATARQGYHYGCNSSPARFDRNLFGRLICQFYKWKPSERRTTLLNNRPKCS